MKPCRVRVGGALRHRWTADRRRLRPLWLLLLAGLFGARPAGATISYRVSLAHPEEHLFQVTMTVPVEGNELTTAFPAWNALYRVRDFAERVRDVTAVCSAAAPVPLGVRKIDKQDWHISLAGPCAPGGRNTIVIRYEILWDEPGPFDSQLNPRHAFLNPAEVLMYVPQRRAEDVSLELADLPEGWRTATALPPSQGNNTYAAANYDALADAPIEAGKFEEFGFESDGAPIRVVVDGKDWNRGSLKSGLQQVTGYELHLMGGPPFDPPERSYTFLIHFGSPAEAGGGGMEHRNSSAISGASVGEVVATAAHEFFHAWNVKRIRPQSLEPVDYSREQYTRALWFAEGVSNTYEAYALERTGLITKDQFYKSLGEVIFGLQSRPARLWQSAEESSLDAWFEGYGEYADPARSISYYDKGEILGVLLDLAIRDATDDHQSLDDVMRRMNQEYARQGRPYNESEGVQAVVEEVAGKSFEDFFRRYVAGTEELPYRSLLAVAGLQLAPDPEKSAPPYQLSEIPHATERQIRIRQGLLRGATE